MHPSQIQAILAMIDGMTAQLQGLRQIVGAGYRTPQPPGRRQAPPPDQYLNDQEEQLLDQAMGVGPQGQPVQQWQQQAPQPQHAAMTQWAQQPIQQPIGQGGQYAQPFNPQVAQAPFQAPQRPFYMPNNLDQHQGGGEPFPPPQMPPNQNAIARLFQDAARNGALDPSLLQQQG